MYKVFVNDIPIILSTESELDEKYLTIPIKEAKIKRIIKRINKGQLLYVNLYHPKEEKLLKHLFKKEEIQACAIREVEEETGVQGLQVHRLLDRTYHIFQRKGKFRIKETYWYEMTTDYQGELVPEVKEGITKVKWKDQEKARKALRKSYANIKMLFPESLLPEYSKHGVS